MSLMIPTIGGEPGPAYATDINNSLTLIDQHDHTPGHGVKITPAAININSTLQFNSNDMNGVTALTLSALGSPPSNNGSVYESGVDLFYKDGNGNAIRLTQGGSIAGAAGSISGLTSPAAAVFSVSTGTFIWQSNSSTPTAANMDFAAALFRNRSPNSTFAVTLQAPANLSSNYTLTLPTLPGGPAFLQIDSAGNIYETLLVAGGLTTTNLSPTAGILGSQLSASAGILATQIHDNSVGGGITGAQISNSANIAATQLVANGITNTQINSSANIAISKLEAVNIATSASSGNYTLSSTTPQNVTNLVASVTTSGKPVHISIQSDTTGNSSFFGVGTNSVSVTSNLNLRIIRGASTVIATMAVASTIGATTQTSVSPPSMVYIDTGATAGSNGYTIQAYVDDANAVGYVQHCQLLVYEIA